MSTGPLPLPSPRISEGGGEDWTRSRSPSPNPALRGQNPEMASGRASPEEMPLDPVSESSTAYKQTTSYQPLHWEKGQIQEGNRPHVIRYWPLELLAISGALTMMGITVFLLIFFHNKDYYEAWPIYELIKLSTVIASLATATRSCMLFAIAEIIGQIKWVWFTRRTRPLYHLYQFDEASRGIPGSIEILPMLFKNLRSRLAAYALAAVTIVLVGSAFGPSTQQALGMRPCDKILTNTTAKIPVANFATGDLYHVSAFGEVEATVDMKGIIVEALTNPEGLDTAVKPLNCTTGRCIFRDYGTPLRITHASIGVCSRCRDHTTQAIRSPNGVVTLPITGGQLPPLQIHTLPPYQPLFASAFVPNYSSEPDLSDTALGTVHVLTGGRPLGGQAAVHAATSCSLYPCLKTYNGHVLSGRLTETLVTTVPTVKQTSPSNPSLGNYTAIRLPCILDTDPWEGVAKWYDETNITKAEQKPHRTWGSWRLQGQPGESKVPNACLYKLDFEYAKALTKFFSTLLNGTCTYEFSQGDDLQCGDKWWLSPLFARGHPSFASLDATFGNMTTVVTNRLRTTGWGPNDIRPPQEWRGPGYGISGTVIRTTTCVFFDWPWIIPPAVMLLTSTALLVWTVTKNYTEQQIPLWKSDPLPLMFFGFGKKGVTGRDVPEGVSISAMHKKSKGIQVQCLVDDQDDGPGLVKRGVGTSGLRRRRDGREGYRMDTMLLGEDV